jgi:Protein of unknown function (DUF2852)
MRNRVQKLECAMFQADPSAAVYAQGGRNWFRRSEDWLDARGRKAWIVAMVLGFIVFWPVGLALLAYMIWGKKMFNQSCSNRREDMRSWGRGRDYRMTFGSSGNNAFDAYKADTLRRLEEEQTAFESFLQRLRDAKDKSEFDSFMDDRARANRMAEQADAGSADTAPPKTGEY